MTQAHAVTAYFDGLCPICTHEMAHYAQAAPELIRLHDCNGDIPEDIDRAAALASLHVRLPDGTIVDGWLAFIAIWERLPGRHWRWLAAATRPAPIRIPLNQIYLWLAPLRPRKTCQDGACATDT